MDITKIPQYELLEHHYVRELESEGYLMRHKKTGWKMMTTIKYLTLHLELFRQTAQVWLILLSTLCFADLIATRSRIRLLSWQRDL